MSFILIKNFVNNDRIKEDTAHYNKVLSEIDPISEDLRPFFHIKNNKCFMSLYYLSAYKSILTTDYSLQFVQRELVNYDTVRSNLIKFYFEDISDEQFEKCKNSLEEVCKLIKDSNYNNDVKTSLFSFFADPIAPIQRLSMELLEKGFWLSQKYEKIYYVSEKLRQTVDIDYMVEKLNSISMQKVKIENNAEIAVSFCFILISTVKSLAAAPNIVFLLGIRYDESIDHLLFENNAIRFDLFGNALSVQGRIDMLDYIERIGEVNIKDIEHEFDISGTTAYYHLSMLIKANMLKTRNQGRLIMYSVNRDFFDTACKKLIKYTNGRG